MLKALVGESILAIGHFGSTAVPDLAAEPIIDILIAVASIETARIGFVSRLESLGYVFWADNPKTDRLFFVKGMPPFGERRTHHVHIAERPSEMWDRLLFRDYLRYHPEDARRYAALKRGLAVEHRQDRETYTRAKSAFISEIMALAQAEQRIWQSHRK